ncbi:inorganic phosphate transporter [Lutibaculum baratangense]|uniref:Phosphate transporter n=1 Tax=Lutibaculum baratangense AMV1 TaxID=631454 RepID=V4RMW4_9HYPH|nr:inorganic phosphate transporter [Lutibaculum baratangense]ESR24560.1 putative low-affinity inorganic phosphate transporter [Lutibaculum baratangense AMV1]
MPKHAVDKELKKLARLDEASSGLTRAIAPPGLAIVFLAAVAVFAATFVASGPLGLYVVVAAFIAGYMALYVGANDVANNMGPAVGGRTLTLMQALIIAAIFEAAGALIAGGDVVGTISKDIVRPAPTMETTRFIIVMMAGFLAAAMWIHLATYLGAPVSTTHSVVGGVLGSAVAASGLDVVNWPTMGAIAASWIISPVMGGVIAAALLWALKRTVLLREDDRVRAGRRYVPAMVGLMAGVFTSYLMLKGLSHVWAPPTWLVLAAGLLAFLAGWIVARPWIRQQSVGMPDERKAVANLFALPLIISTAFLSFAHGANDVANAVGPLAAIVSAAGSGMAAPQDVPLPLWVLMIGAVGISTGLALFGPRVIRTVGQSITRMNASRAFCVALSAAVTVLVASALGLPVSSTHVAVGGVFGVGFLRERLMNKGIPNPAVQPRTRFLKVATLNETPEQAVARMQKRQKRYLVRRRYALAIGAAWVVTVPASALLAATLYGVLSLATVGSL